MYAHCLYFENGHYSLHYTHSLFNTLSAEARSKCLLLLKQNLCIFGTHLLHMLQGSKYWVRIVSSTVAKLWLYHLSMLKLEIDTFNLYMQLMWDIVDWFSYNNGVILLLIAVDIAHTFTHLLPSVNTEAINRNYSCLSLLNSETRI